MIDINGLYLGVGGIAGLIVVIASVGKMFYARSLNNHWKEIKEEMRLMRKCLEK